MWHFLSRGNYACLLKISVFDKITQRILFLIQKSLIHLHTISKREAPEFESILLNIE